jgi:hypothetical protein
MSRRDVFKAVGLALAGLVSGLAGCEGGAGEGSKDPDGGEPEQGKGAAPAEPPKS